MTHIKNTNSVTLVIKQIAKKEFIKTECTVLIRA